MSLSIALLGCNDFDILIPIGAWDRLTTPCMALQSELVIFKKNHEAGFDPLALAHKNWVITNHAPLRQARVAHG